MAENFLITRYGKIPKEELIVEKIPHQPNLKLSNEVNYLYDDSIDKISAPIWIKLHNGIIERLKKESKIKVTDIKWIRTGSSPHKIKLPLHLDPRLSYLVGYLYGDGGFKDIRKTHKKHKRFEHKIIVGDEFEIQIERIQILFKELFNLNTKMRDERIKKGENMYYINPTCKIVYRFFVKAFGFKEGPKGKIVMPKIIKNSNSELKIWFLRGFMDAEGDFRATEYYLNRKLPSPRVKVRLADENFVKQLKKHLNREFNLNLTGPYSDGEKDWYVQCGKRGSLEAERQILFTHPIKRWRIEKYIREGSSA